MSENLTWGKVAQIILPIILTFLGMIIGFLAVQTLSLREAIGDLKVQIGKQDVRIQNLSSKIGEITVTKLKRDREEVRSAFRILPND